MYWVSLLHLDIHTKRGLKSPVLAIDPQDSQFTDQLCDTSID